MQANCILIASNFAIHPQMCNFGVEKSESFSILANIIFHVTIVLVISFCDQFVAPKIRHSRRRCSVCQQSNGIQ